MRRESGRRMRGGGKEGGLGERSVRRDREKEESEVDRKILKRSEEV